MRNLEVLSLSVNKCVRGCAVFRRLQRSAFVF
jgi:hypothetical protein